MKTAAELEYEYNGRIGDPHFNGEEFFAMVQRDAMEYIMELVREVRRLQQIYFRTRDREVMKACKVFEKKLDDAVRHFWQPESVIDADPKEEHPKLF